MKKKIIILALILVSFISLLRSQPVTDIRVAELKSMRSNAVELSFTREGNNLAVSAKTLDWSPDDSLGIVIRIKFAGNTRKEFEQFAGVVSLGKLQLKIVDETTGKSTEIWPADRENNLGDGIANYRLVITFPESHAYKFMLNGKVIGTGYKPK